MKLESTARQNLQLPPIAAVHFLSKDNIQDNLPRTLQLGLLVPYHRPVQLCLDFDDERPLTHVEPQWRFASTYLSVLDLMEGFYKGVP